MAADSILCCIAQAYTKCNQHTTLQEDHTPTGGVPAHFPWEGRDINPKFWFFSLDTHLPTQ